jgi:hypothetical protein
VCVHFAKGSCVDLDDVLAEEGSLMNEEGQASNNIHNIQHIHNNNIIIAIIISVETHTLSE